MITFPLGDLLLGAIFLGLIAYLVIRIVAHKVGTWARGRSRP